MSKQLRAMELPGPRYVDPKAPLERQISVLLSLTKDPPENSRVVVITPELAQWILDNRNSRNRKRRAVRIKRYAMMMESAAWVLSGDTIKFGRSGRLLDGQNRLAAVVRANTVFRTHVIFGIDDDAFDVIDSGKSRTPNDTLFTAGVSHSEIVTPAIRWIQILRSDKPMDRGRSFTNQEVLEYYKTQVDHDRMSRAVEGALKAHKLIPRGSLAACLYLFDERNPNASKKFTDDLAAVRRAGRKLPDKFARLRSNTMGRLHENMINATIIKAWNAFRANKTVTAHDLVWNENQSFPTVAS